MQLFYGTDIVGNIMTLSELESSHCARVLRMKSGDSMDMTDGKGNFYKGTIQLAHDKKTTVEVIETIAAPALPYQLHLYVALTKQSDRLEWMLEKCVEMGLTSFTPIITHRTERKNIRIDRLELIALSAMKQSLKAWLPVIHLVTPIANAIANAKSTNKLIAHCMEEDPKGSKKLELSRIQTNNVSIFIGPEGDFTKEEVEQAHLNLFNSVSLGKERLRTETAGLMACSFMYLNNINTQLNR